jgi:hypothetical protein
MPGSCLRRFVVLVCLSVGLFVPSLARADLIISIGSTSIVEGGTGFVDVFIRSDDINELLSGFSFEFVISPMVGSNVLAFSDPQSDAQLNDPNYILAGASAAAGPPQTAVGVVSPETTYVGVDGTPDASGVPVPLTNRLLARLDLSTLSSTPAVAGNVFSIDLANTLQTIFFDDTFAAIPYTYTPGVVTVSAASSVPEPSSLLLCTGALGAAGLIRRSRARRVDNQTV